LWWRREAIIDSDEGLDLCDKASIETNRASKETRGARENSSLQRGGKRGG
jgi:hypothetical protein